jgi:hypothetical protein
MDAASEGRDHQLLDVAVGDQVDVNGLAIGVWHQARHVADAVELDRRLEAVELNHFLDAAEGLPDGRLAAEQEAVHVLAVGHPEGGGALERPAQEAVHQRDV